MSGAPVNGGRLPGAPNNFQRIDDTLWRGARPTLPQAAWLVSVGIKSVINLELFEEDKESFGAYLAKLQYRHMPDWEPIATFDPAAEDAHLRDFLDAVHALPKPIYCHCRDGQNRTGLAVAAYRLIVRGDPLDAVLADMESFKGLWEIPDANYLRSLDGRAAQFKGKLAA